MFIKGKSGNPLGRPKATHDVRVLAKQYTREALERLVHWMREGDSRTSVAAAVALLDRAHGKPAQAIQFQGEDGLPVGMTVMFHEPERVSDDRVPAEASRPLSS